MAPRLAALSVDLDEIRCYTAIHGLSAPGEDVENAVYRRAVPRFEALFAELSVPATFFAIGADLEDPQAAEALRRLSHGGHEVGNHTHDHLYDLTRRDAPTMGAQIDGGADAIAAVTDEAPVGFRAPGYTVSAGVLQHLKARDYLYDSSVFPCPAYYGAKSAALGVIALRGRRSHSILDTPQVLRCPADPYRVGEPYWTRGDGILELPIGVTRDMTARLPYIGTSLSVFGAGALTRAIVGRPLVNLELHGIDLADAAEDGLGFLAPYQHDLRIPLQRRRRALCDAIGQLRDAGYRFVTLADAARAFGSS